MAIHRWIAAVLMSAIPVVMAPAWSCGPGGETMEQMRRTEAEGDPPPEGYLSVEAFVAERRLPGTSRVDRVASAAGVAFGRRRGSTPSEEPWPSS